MDKIDSDELCPCFRSPGHFSNLSRPLLPTRRCQFFDCVTARFSVSGTHFSSNCCQCQRQGRFKQVVPRAMSPRFSDIFETWCSEKVKGLITDSRNLLSQWSRSVPSRRRTNTSLPRVCAPGTKASGRVDVFVFLFVVMRCGFPSSVRLTIFHQLSGLPRCARQTSATIDKA